MRLRNVMTAEVIIVLGGGSLPRGRRYRSAVGTALSVLMKCAGWCS